MEPTPFVSVVIPCRNADQHIGRALESVLANDYPRDRLEVPVTEGRGSNETLAIAERLAARHSQIRIIDNPGRRLAVALNLAVRNATGDVFLRADSSISRVGAAWRRVSP